MTSTSVEQVKTATAYLRRDPLRECILYVSPRVRVILWNVIGGNGVS